MCERLQPYVSQVATALLQLDRELTVSILYANQSPEDILCQAPPVAPSVVPGIASARHRQ